MTIFDQAALHRGFPSFECLPWTTNTWGACCEARSMLARERDVVKEVGSYLASIDPADVPYLTSLSAEKSTHYKWYLGSGRGYWVWLHTYRAAREYAAVGGHAASIHNHRYSFTSRVVSGGLHTTAFRRMDNGAVRVDTRSFVGPGETLLLHDKDVHQVSAVEERTVTLVVQGPPVRRYSTVWASDGSSSRDVFDLDHLFGEFKQQLGLRPHSLR